MFPESSTQPLPNPQAPDTVLRHSSHTRPSHRPIHGPDTPRPSTPHPLCFCQHPAMPGQKLILFSPSLYVGIPCATAKSFGWCAHISGGRRTEAYPTLTHCLCHCPAIAPTAASVLFLSSSRGVKSIIRKTDYFPPAYHRHCSPKTDHLPLWCV